MSDLPAARWWADDADKAHAERRFLLYAPAWMLTLGVLMLLGIPGRLSDVGMLAVSLAVSLPLLVVPAIGAPTSAPRRLRDRYFIKANLWLAIFGFIGNYFLSEYFFDVLGMVYAFPLRWTFDAELVGQGKQSVPIAMYLLTQPFFVTYHVSATVLLRRARTSRRGSHPAARVALTALVAYVWAFLETLSMANPLMREHFRYRDMPTMLRYGSLFYACYFLVSFPLFLRIDEREPTPLGRCAIEALAAGMLVFLLLDLITKLLRA
ncbi:MAG: hypothetical protein KC503_27680 [Myxococcales bacterium]|nr:hypothetical protein [Myxococcales bacterium]